MLQIYSSLFNLEKVLFNMSLKSLENWKQETTINFCNTDNKYNTFCFKIHLKFKTIYPVKVLFNSISKHTNILTFLDKNNRAYRH